VFDRCSQQRLDERARAWAFLPQCGSGLIQVVFGQVTAMGMAVAPACLTFGDGAPPWRFTGFCRIQPLHPRTSAHLWLLTKIACASSVAPIGTDPVTELIAKKIIEIGQTARSGPDWAIGA
jgi:hypothetical protein